MKDFLWKAGYFLVGVLLLLRVWHWYTGGGDLDLDSEYAKQRFYLWCGVFVAYLLVVPAVQAWRIRNA